MQTRKSGILLHPSSLPGDYGIGSLGQEAERFLDSIAAAGQSVWQTLPLGPTGWGDSPYATFSAFAGNPLLIDLGLLVDWKDLKPADLPPGRPTEGRVDFGLALEIRQQLFPKAAQTFFTSASSARREAYADFCARQAFWLNDYSLFHAARQHFRHQPWTVWPEELRDRTPLGLQSWGERLQEEIRLQKYVQFVFFQQWQRIKAYATELGIEIFGDLPIFVAHDSSDVWCNRHLFHLDAEGMPTVVSGVPPDYFSASGQRWGNPLYNWEMHQTDRFRWWLARIGWSLTLFDLVRIDHFRGFCACWEIPADEPTAINGRWRQAPGEELFSCLRQELGTLPLIAEDLGVITADVDALRQRFEMPGMRVLQFAFDGSPDNPHLPHNHQPDSVVYSGTHDNTTSLAWWNNATDEERNFLRQYLGKKRLEQPWDLLRLAASSTGYLAIYPMQDILGLDGRARMNQPGKPNGNWSWQMESSSLPEDIQGRLLQLTRTFGRHPKPADR